MKHIFRISKTLQNEVASTFQNFLQVTQDDKKYFHNVPVETVRFHFHKLGVGVNSASMWIWGTISEWKNWVQVVHVRVLAVAIWVFSALTFTCLYLSAHVCMDWRCVQYSQFSKQKFCFTSRLHSTGGIHGTVLDFFLLSELVCPFKSVHLAHFSSSFAPQGFSRCPWGLLFNSSSHFPPCPRILSILNRTGFVILLPVYSVTLDPKKKKKITHTRVSLSQTLFNAPACGSGLGTLSCVQSFSSLLPSVPKLPPFIWLQKDHLRLSASLIVCNVCSTTRVVLSALIAL